jgi:poly-beta-1,6-N-acetyl-D-glucosamine biosynthesis protein PgaD
MNPRNRQPDQSRLRFAIEVGATTFFWGMWAYFVAPLLSLVLWYFGFRLFFEEMVGRSGYQAFIEQLENYGLAILAMLIVTLAWIYWNRNRYGGVYNTRKHMMAPVSLLESADMAGLPPEQLEQVQARSWLLLDFCEHDRLIVRDPGAASSPLAAHEHSRIS